MLTSLEASIADHVLARGECIHHHRVPVDDIVYARVSKLGHYRSAECLLTFAVFQARALPAVLVSGICRVPQLRVVELRVRSIEFVVEHI